MDALMKNYRVAAIPLWHFTSLQFILWQVLALHQVHTFVHCHVSKDKAIPLQAWTGPEVSRRLMLPDLKTVGT